MEVNREITLLAEVFGGMPPYSFVWTTDEMSWFNCPNCEETTFSATQSSEITLLVTDANGCEAFVTFQIMVLPQKDFEFDQVIYVPNVFSPNGDELNDTFEIFPADPSVQILSMQIFNRWGGLIFENRNYVAGGSNGWNGQLDGELVNPGFFVYKVAFRDDLGEVGSLVGSLSLLR